MSNELEDLFAEAEQATQKQEEKISTTYKRDDRLMDCSGTRTIYFRVFPDLKGDPMTYLPYKNYAFKSCATGKMVYAGTSPLFFGETDFLGERQKELWNTDPEKAKVLFATEKRLVNVFIIKDTLDDSNDQTFKVWNYTAKPTDPKRPRAGSPMMKCLDKLLNDPDVPVSQKDIYNLGPDGITFKMIIKQPEKKGDFVDVEVVSFNAGTAVQGFGGFPADKLLDIYRQKSADISDMIEPCKTQAELEVIYKTHILCVTNKSTEATQNSYFGDDEDDDEDNSIQLDLGDTKNRSSGAPFKEDKGIPKDPLAGSPSDTQSEDDKLAKLLETLSD